MSHKPRTTLAQVMAILALLGILLSVVGTAWIGTQPLPSTVPLISGEQNIQSTSVPVILPPTSEK